jgi:hypothetical protein
MWNLWYQWKAEEEVVLAWKAFGILGAQLRF